MSDPADRSPSRIRSFEMRHLRYYVALVDERNFERAAGRLGIAQPGLSQQIMNLEAIVGTPLLDRSRRSVNLTQSGEVFYEEAKKILSQSESALIATRRVSRGESGQLSIGYVASAAYSGAVVEAIKLFRADHPGVEIKLVEMELRQQLARIAEGLLDFGFIRWPAPIPDGISTHIVKREPLSIVLPADHPQAMKREAALSTFKSETFLTPLQPRDVGFHSTTYDACHEAGFEPAIAPAGFDFTGIASMVAIGAGVTIVPKSMERVDFPGVRHVPLAGLEVTSDLAVAYRKIDPSPAVKAFVAMSRRT